MRPTVSRRVVLKWIAGLVAVVAAWGPRPLLAGAPDGDVDGDGLRVQLPERQHAWDESLATDESGNHVPPRFHRLLFFDVASQPDSTSARLLESRLRTLESRYPWGPSGLLFLAAWGPGYWERWLRTAPPIEYPKPLTTFEIPVLDDYDMCLHLASDNEDRLEQLESALVRGEPLGEVGASVDLRPVLTWRETRTGFVGDGLAAERMDVAGIPSDAPLSMGFRSGFRRNQATEDDVTVSDGPLVGWTTMHVNALRVRLKSWYGLLDDDQRVARMFAPQLGPQDVAALTDEAPTFSEVLEETAEEHGVVGHLQAVGQARREDRPVILRRDFDTLDGDEPGLHFVSLQRTIADFVATQQAMNASHLAFINPSVQARDNNGINEFIFALSRGNYLVPPRRQRAFPMISGSNPRP